MIALYIILGIILFFILVLSIRAHIHIEYEKEVMAYAKWAFLKIPLFPRPQKPAKPKKDNEKKEEKPKEEKPKEEKPKGPNPLAVLYENEKIQGIMEILNRLVNLIYKLGHRFVDSFVIDEMFLDITVSKGDAAETAEAYGKMCYKVFPVTGAVCANCNVKKYSINIDPDYLAAPGNECAFSMEISLIPRRLINAVIAFAFGALFKVGFRLLKGIKPKKSDEEAKGNNKTEENEDFQPQSDMAPIKEVVYGKYDEGSVSEPDVYVDYKKTDNEK